MSSDETPAKLMSFIKILINEHDLSQFILNQSTILVVVVMIMSSLALKTFMHSDPDLWTCSYLFCAHLIFLSLMDCNRNLGT